MSSQFPQEFNRFINSVSKKSHIFLLQDLVSSFVLSKIVLSSNAFIAPCIKMAKHEAAILKFSITVIIILYRAEREYLSNYQNSDTKIILR